MQNFFKVSFGKSLSRVLNVRGTHFNDRPTGEASTVLLERTRWHHFNASGGDVNDDDSLLTLTSKILFDSSANLKTIDLGLVLKETSLCWTLLSAPPQWANWLVDFFTVVVSCAQFTMPKYFCTNIKILGRLMSLQFVPENWCKFIFTLKSHRSIF